MSHVTTERHRTRDLVVVVPGILGSKLRTLDGREAWNPSLALAARYLAPFGEALDRLRLPPDVGDGPAPEGHALTPMGQMPGWQVWPGFWSGAGYPALRDSLLEDLQGGHQQLMLHSYDWRLSNAHNAIELLHQAERRLDRWQKGDGGPDARIQLVCHSMGGLIGRYFLHVLKGKEITRRAYTIGTPYSGSVKAVRVLTGQALPPRLDWLNEKMSEVAQTFPSVAELLPTYNCVVDGGTPYTLAGREVPGLERRLVDQGGAFHKEVAEEEAEAADRNMYVLGGAGQPTDQAVDVGSEQLCFLQTQRGEDRGGDGTVATFSSVPPHLESRWNKPMFYPAKHVGLTRHQPLLKDLNDMINEEPLSQILSPPQPLSLAMPEVALAGDPVPLRVSAEQTDLRLEARFLDPEGRQAGRSLPLRPDGEGNYDTVVTPPPGLWQVVVTTPAVSPPSHIEDLLLVTAP